MAQSQFASRVVGIEVDRVNLRTFVIAAVIAAVGGGLAVAGHPLFVADGARS